MLRRNLLSVLLLISCASLLQAQQGAPAPSPKKTPTQCLIKDVVGQNNTPKPAKAKSPVIPVVQRLNGFDALTFMMNRGRDIQVVDKSFLYSFEVHVNIVAGFTIVDGDTIVTRLPQAELVYALTTKDNRFWTPMARAQAVAAQSQGGASATTVRSAQNQPSMPKVSGQGGGTVSSTPAGVKPSATVKPSTTAPTLAQPKAVTPVPAQPQISGSYTPFPGSQVNGAVSPSLQAAYSGQRVAPPMVVPDNVAIFAENGCEFSARFIGMDDSTGLSLLEVEGLNQTPLPEADVKKLLVNQRVKLFAPLPTEQQAQVKTNLLSMKVKTLVGQLKVIEKNHLTGEVKRMVVSSKDITPALLGGVVLNEWDEAIGVIESVTATGEARVIPIANVKQAIDRVRSRKPRPLLGLRGESVTIGSFNRLTGLGWGKTEAAGFLSRNPSGLLVTDVTPETPAALSQLKSGDIILSVNKTEIKTQSDFTAALNSVGGNKEAYFELLRPSAGKTQTVSVKLEEALDPREKMREIERRQLGIRTNNLFLTLGIGVILVEDKQPNKPRVPNSSVIWAIYPDSAAARAGLQRGDVIETVNGEPANTVKRTSLRGEITLTVIRNNQTLVFKINPLEEVKR